MSNSPNQALWKFNGQKDFCQDFATPRHSSSGPHNIELSSQVDLTIMCSNPKLLWGRVKYSEEEQDFICSCTGGRGGEQKHALGHCGYSLGYLWGYHCGYLWADHCGYLIRIFVSRSMWIFTKDICEQIIHCRHSLRIFVRSLLDVHKGYLWVDQSGYYQRIFVSWSLCRFPVGAANWALANRAPGKFWCGKLGPRRFYLANCWCKDVKNYILKCPMHKYWNTNTQI